MTEMKGPFAEIVAKMDPEMDPEKARTWYYTQSRKLEEPIDPKVLLKQAVSRDYARTFVRPGRMYMFAYSPKTRATIPYYDRFPLVFPFDVREDGFTAINMHYLPPVYRALMMDGLMQYIRVGNNDDQTKIRLSYELLTSVSRLRWFRPAVKSYLNTHVRSRFMLVPHDEWNVAIMLPLESFAKKGVNVVFKDSRQIIRNGN